jgi:hypothetical protein
VPVHRHRWIGLLLGQHAIDGVGDLRQLRCVKAALAPGRSKAGRQQQRIVLAQWNIESLRQPQHHLPARRCAAKLQKAQMSLRDVGPAGQFQLRQTSALAPPLQPGGKVGAALHEYLPGSCRYDLHAQHGTSDRGTGDDGWAKRQGW